MGRRLRGDLAMYQTGDTIKETVQAIQQHKYVLPAIQREFVWSPEQIAMLFDSLMQGYPVGTLLLWRVEAESARKYRYYDFVRDYHEKDARHCPKLPEQREALTAVLDGQQRLTALNIGLLGSMAVKVRGKWWNNPDAFPRKKLYLNLLSGAEADEEGSRYEFRFLSARQLEQAGNDEECWFCVGDILDMEGGPAMLEWLNERLPQEQTTDAYKVLDRLHRVVHTDQVIAYYEEKSQELSRVLNIFIRMNSGGTVLSYSDLLLSIAVAQWSRLDAREEIHRLVDELGEIGDGFHFSQDLVLKAGLVLSDIGDVGFKVENFDEANMAKLEERWESIRDALHLTARLLASFGYNGQNLRASSVLLPVAYYLARRAPGPRYVTIAKYAEDRERVRKWIAKSLLKTSGIWGSGLDTLLTALRNCIRDEGQDGFPARALEVVMAKRGKSLQFEPEELEEILDLKYGKAQTFTLLSLLFPTVDLQQHHHVDHVFPKSGFGKKKLRAWGLSEEDIEACRASRDQVANLQLLEGHANIEKQDMIPQEWLEGMYCTVDQQAAYRERHLLPDLLGSWADYCEFYARRRELLRQRLADILGVSLVQGAGAQE